MSVDVAARARESAHTTRAPKASNRFAKRAERRSQLGTEEFGFLPRGEVSALVDLVEVDQVAKGAPGPCLRGSMMARRLRRGRPYCEHDNSLRPGRLQPPRSTRSSRR